jgi:hypothetical protein
MAAEVNVARKASGGRRQNRITHGKPRGQDFAGWVDVEETDAEGSNQGRENLEPGVISSGPSPWLNPRCRVCPVNRYTNDLLIFHNIFLYQILYD